MTFGEGRKRTWGKERKGHKFLSAVRVRKEGKRA